mgnify:CR=1 FL=1
MSIAAPQLPELFDRYSSAFEDQAFEIEQPINEELNAKNIPGKAHVIRFLPGTDLTAYLQIQMTESDESLASRQNEVMDAIQKVINGSPTMSSRARTLSRSGPFKEKPAVLRAAARKIGILQY